MSVAQASRQAYGRMKSVDDAKDHPVYKFLKTFGTGTDGYSNRQIAAIMGKPINTITPRIFELREAGVVVLAGKRKDLYSGIEVSHWRIATEAEEKAWKFLKAVGAEPRGLQPRVWTHLADIPEGVMVRETSHATWWWVRLPGLFKSSASAGKFWSTPRALTEGESFYGPVTEVL